MIKEGRLRDGVPKSDARVRLKPNGNLLVNVEERRAARNLDDSDESKRKSVARFLHSKARRYREHGRPGLPLVSLSRLVGKLIAPIKVKERINRRFPFFSSRSLSFVSFSPSFCFKCGCTCVCFFLFFFGSCIFTFPLWLIANESQRKWRTISTSELHRFKELRCRQDSFSNAKWGKNVRLFDESRRVVRCRDAIIIPRRLYRDEKTVH